MMARRLGLIALGLPLPIVLLVAYGLWSEQAENFFFPPLSEIAGVFVDTWLFERIASDFVPSLWRMLAGYGLSIVLGVGFGVLLGLSRLARTAADPIIEFCRALPAPALIPFALLLFGAGDSGKVFIILLGTIWPILLNTVDGVRGVSSMQLDMARSYQVPATARLWHIILPAASPRIFAGMRTSLGTGIILMVVSEMVASENGIGYYVVESQRTLAIPDMWGGVVLLGILGFVLNWVFLVIERRALRWHRGAAGLVAEPIRRAGAASQSSAGAEVNRA